MNQPESLHTMMPVEVSQVGRVFHAAFQLPCQIDGKTMEVEVTGIDTIINGKLRDAPIPPTAPESTKDEQIKHMVDRFLGWQLPKDFNPDGGVSYKVPNYTGAALENHRLFGTNLFDATQAEAMIRHLVDGMPEST